MVMKTRAIIIIALAGLFASCNPDVQLSSKEDMPKIAEHLLGMTTGEGIKYLNKHGYIASGKNYTTTDIEKRQVYNFTNERASSQLSFYSTADSIQEVSAFKSIYSEEKAFETYWKWSHYTATEIYSSTPCWFGLILTYSPTKNRRYIDGSKLDQMQAALEEDYKNGKINQPMYEQCKYFVGREQFWEDTKSIEEGVESIRELYFSQARTYDARIIEDENFPPKQIEMSMLPSSNGITTLTYTTRNYIPKY